MKWFVGCETGFLLRPLQLFHTWSDMPNATSPLMLSPPPLSILFFFNSLCLCRLRALSGGGGSGSGGGGSGCAVASPPLSPALPKYKLADYRYGREEMLALYVKDNKVGRLKMPGFLNAGLKSMWFEYKLYYCWDYIYISTTYVNLSYLNAS